MLSEEEKLRELLEWLKARTNPETIAMILKDVRPISLKRTTRWVRIFLNLNKVVRPIVDKHGVTGVARSTYYDYSKTLWKWLSKYPENLWPKFIDASRAYYIEVLGAKSEVLDEITPEAVRVIREVKEQLRRGSLGSEGAEAGHTSEAVGEVGRPGEEHGSS
jgi:ACT domain-containing protein